MRVLILGSAAGGGVPQWNCGCPNCQAARAQGTARTQSSIAVSADGQRWALVNASPDLRQQLAAHPRLAPAAVRDTPISAVVLTDAEIDHTLGLMLLREASAPIPVYAPAGVAALLGAEWPLWRVLEPYAGTDVRELPEGRAVALADRGGSALGLSCRAAASSCQVPRYARARPPAPCVVSVRIEDERRGGVLVYAPAVETLTPAVRALASGADLLLLDGTFWSAAELSALGIGRPDARPLGHLPIGGPDGSLSALETFGAARTIFVHVNNTNPILDPRSSERAALVRAGAAVAEDGAEFEL